VRDPGDRFQMVFKELRGPSMSEQFNREADAPVVAGKARPERDRSEGVPRLE